MARLLCWLLGAHIWMGCKNRVGLTVLECATCGKVEVVD